MNSSKYLCNSWRWSYVQVCSLAHGSIDVAEVFFQSHISLVNISLIPNIAPPISWETLELLDSLSLPFPIVLHFTISYHLYNLKNVKNTHGGVSLLVKLQANILVLLLTFEFVHINFNRTICWHLIRYFKFQETCRSTTDLLTDQIWSHLLKKSLTENYFFYEV